MAHGLFDGYVPEGFFDEVFTPDVEIRPHYSSLVKHLGELTPEELKRRERLRDEAFRSQGITFTVYGEEDGIERTFPMDLLPRVIPADEWAMIEEGLVQRMTALNRFLDDLYVGDRAAIHDGVVPQWLITSASGFCREAFGVPNAPGARCLVAGIDLIRDIDGVYRVLEDNLRNPSGISYVLENRASMTRVVPGAFVDQRVRPVDHYGNMLLDALRHAAPAAAGDDPTVVVLTPGVFNSAYFEHAFLARQMGVELVEGRDLVVDEHVVSMRTTRGLQRVDVIYRRIDDDFLDPVVFRKDSTLGVPGLMAAARGGNVTITNGVGNGVADDKAVYAFVPDMIRYYLGEEPILPNVETYLLWDADQRNAVLDRLDQLVVKPVAESGGYGLLIGPAASDEELATCRAAIEADPRNWIAQEVVQLSRHPTLVGDHLEGRHIDLRPFILTGERVEVIPGGLTRVALRKGSLVVNSSQGGGSKDTWVLAAAEADIVLAGDAPLLAAAGVSVDVSGSAGRVEPKGVPGVPDAVPDELFDDVPPADEAADNNGSNGSNGHRDGRAARPVSAKAGSDMLARHAENMFWAGRYIERAEDTARMLDVTYHGLLEASPVEAEHAWGDLLRTLRLEDAFYARHRVASAATVSEFLVLDPTSPGSIIAQVSRARENVRSVRELVTTELWEAVNVFYLELGQRNLRADLDHQPYALYSMVKHRCQTMSGVAAETMPRDDGWRFLQTGWMLERAEMMCRLLAVRFTTNSMGLDGDESEEAQIAGYHHWLGTLKSASAAEAYRKAHRSSMDPADMLAFLLLSKNFPRSVLFCLRRAEADLARLGNNDGLLTRPERLLGRIRADLEYRDVSEVMEANLANYLDQVQRAVRQVAEAVAIQYFRNSWEIAITPLDFQSPALPLPAS